jgi:hypothetical protein
MPFGLVNGYQCFEGRTIYIDMAEHSRKLQSSSALEWDTQIMQVSVLLSKFRSYPHTLLLLDPNNLSNLIRTQKCDIQNYFINQL